MDLVISILGIVGLFSMIIMSISLIITTLFKNKNNDHDDFNKFGF